MFKKLSTIFFLAVLIFTPFLNQASADLPDNKMSYPSRAMLIKDNFENTKPFGTAEMNWLFFFHIYDMYLWTDAKNWSYDNKFAFLLKYNITAEGEEIAERSVYEIKKYYDITEEQEKIYFKKLNNIFPSVKPDDEIIAIFEPDKNLIFYYNNEFAGKINDMEFARQFMDIWFHQDAGYSNIRRKLLKNEK